MMEQGWAMNQLQYMELVNEGVYIGGSVTMTEHEFIKLVGYGYEACNGAVLLEYQTKLDYYDLIHKEWHRLHKAYGKNKTGVVERYTIDADANGVIQRIGLSLDQKALIRPIMMDIFYIGLHEIMLYASISQSVADPKNNNLLNALRQNDLQFDILIHGRDIAPIWDGKNVTIHFFRMNHA